MTNDKKYFNFFRHMSFFCVLICFSGCCRDPSYTGAVPIARASEWTPNTQKTCYWYRRLSARTPQECQTADFSKPKTVFELIDYALWHNPNTKKTWADARAAAFNVGVEKSYLYPSLSLKETMAWITEDGQGGIDSSNLASLGITSNNLPSTGTGSQNFNVLVTDILLSYLVVDFGGRTANIEAAKQTLYASNWTHNRSLQTVIVDVIDAYYNQINAGAIYLASLRTLEDAQFALDAAEKRYAAGVKNIADVLQARSSAAGAQLNVVDSKGKFLISKGKLARQVGLPANIEIEVDILPDNLEIEKVSESVEQLMCLARERRPDLAAMYANLLEKEAELKSAWSAGMPTITANIEVEDDYFINNTLFNGSNYAGALFLNVPIFNGFYYVNQMREARAKVLSAYADLQNKQYDISLEVLESYYNYQTAVENLVYSQEFLDSSTENYNVALANYKEGTGDILEVLNALKDLAQARSQFVQSRTDWLTSLASIAYTTGTIGNGNEGLPIREDTVQKNKGDRIGL